MPACLDLILWVTKKVLSHGETISYFALKKSLYLYILVENRKTAEILEAKKQAGYWCYSA